MAHTGATPRIFISYSHDTTAHRERVLSLSERLRNDGIETRLDRYVTGTPAEKWPRWMLDQIDWAEFILLVCTETYYHRFRGHKEPGKGKGVDWEGAVITQELYDARSATIKFVPVLFDATDERFIPEPVRGHTFYVLNSEQAYQDLYDFLLGQAGIEPGPVGEPKRKPRMRAKPLIFEGEGSGLGHLSVLDHSNLQEMPLAKVDSGAREGAGRNDDQGRQLSLEACDLPRAGQASDSNSPPRPRGGIPTLVVSTLLLILATVWVLEPDDRQPGVPVAALSEPLGLIAKCERPEDRSYVTFLCKKMHGHFVGYWSNGTYVGRMQFRYALLSVVFSNALVLFISSTMGRPASAKETLSKVSESFLGASVLAYGLTWLAIPIEGALKGNGPLSVPWVVLTGVLGSFMFWLILFLGRRSPTMRR